jgi:hypothetical protein
VPARGVCISSTLLARLWPGLVGDGRSAVDGPIAGDCWVGVGVDDDATPLVEESLLPAPRRYRPGWGLAWASVMENERSGSDVEKLIIVGISSTMDFLIAGSTLAGKEGPGSERLDEPDVDTVESDEEDWCDGCDCLEGWASCCCCCWRVGRFGAGADVDLFS